MEQMKSTLVTAAHILLSAENAITSAYENAKTENELAGTLIDVPAQLQDVLTLIQSVLIEHRSKGMNQPASVTLAGTSRFSDPAYLKAEKSQTRSDLSGRRASGYRD